MRKIEAAPDMLFKTFRTGWANLHPAWKVVSAVLAAWDGVAWLFIGLRWVSAPIWGFVGIAALLAALMAVWLAGLFALILALMAKNPDSHSP